MTGYRRRPARENGATVPAERRDDRPVPWSPLPDHDGEGPPPAQLPEVLDQLLAGLGAPSTDVVIAVAERWSELVGAEIAPHANPVSIERGRLTVSVDNPAWASHLRWSEADLLARLGVMVGDGIITSVITRVARN